MAFSCFPPPGSFLERKFAGGLHHSVFERMTPGEQIHIVALYRLNQDRPKRHIHEEMPVHTSEEESETARALLLREILS